MKAHGLVFMSAHSLFYAANEENAMAVYDTFVRATQE